MARRERTTNSDLAALTTFLADSATMAPSQYAFIRRCKVLCFFADPHLALGAVDS